MTKERVAPVTIQTQRKGASHYRAEQVTVNLKGLENMLGLKTTISEADQIKGLKRL